MSDHDLPPVFLTFGLHAHQPVGNFGHVFGEHLEDVYEPFLRKSTEGGFLPLTLHLSGPLLDWLEENRPSYLDLVGRLVSDGQLELLLAGYYEPILPSLCREDRIGLAVAEEYVPGVDLDHFLRRACLQGDHDGLRWALRRLASFLASLHGRSLGERRADLSPVERYFHDARTIIIPMAPPRYRSW